MNGTNGIKLAGVAQYELAGSRSPLPAISTATASTTLWFRRPMPMQTALITGSVYVVFGHGGAFPAELQLGAAERNERV
jgi:hypothetical protein